MASVMVMILLCLEQYLTTLFDKCILLQRYFGLTEQASSADKY